MRIAIWSYAAAVSMTAIAIAIISSLFERILLTQFGSKPLPPVTSILISNHWWALVISAAWILMAIWLTRSCDLRTEKALAFAGISTLAIVFSAAFTAVAIICPFVSFITPLK